MDREELLREAAEEHLLQESDRRRFLYADVEQLICDGVLVAHVDFHGQHIAFRTRECDQVRRVKFARLR